MSSSARQHRATVPAPGAPAGAPPSSAPGTPGCLVSPPQLDAAFAALADPVRRQVIQVLRERPRRAGEVADSLGLSPPALSRHLRALRRAGLIREEGVEEDARVRIYHLVPGNFAPLRDWVGQAAELWDEQLQAFKAYVEATGSTAP